MYMPFLNFGEVLTRITNFYLSYPEELNSAAQVINNYAVKIIRLMGKGIN